MLQEQADTNQETTGMQAAIQGTSHSDLFKLPTFHGFPQQDVREWIKKFEQISKFYGWSNARKINVIPLALDGPARAWFYTLPEETTSDLESLLDALKERFGAESLEFFFRQELYSRKQGVEEPLSTYTEDIIKKCQRLSLSDNDLMNIFINGLNERLRNSVILKQPKNFAEAENFARLTDAVKRTPGLTSSSPSAKLPQQEQRIKELEGQVNLLISLATQKKAATQPIAPICGETINTIGNPIPDQRYPCNELQKVKSDILAAIDARFEQNAPSRSINRFRQTRPMNAHRGRNLRTTDGQPICNNCMRVGHVARYCRERQFHASSQNQSAQRTFPPPGFGNGPQTSFNLNETASSRVGTMKTPHIYDVTPPNIMNKHHPAQVRKDRTMYKEQPPSDSISNRFDTDVVYVEKAKIAPKVPAISSHVKNATEEKKNVLIWGVVLSQAFQVLVDTGAAVTVISEKFFNDILRARFLLEKCDAVDCIRTANGNTVSVTGCASFPVTLGNSEYICKALVVPGLAYNVVLGRDFLHEFSAVINVGAELVTFCGTNDISFVSNDSPPFVSDVRTTHTFVIDGNSETAIPPGFTRFSPQPVIGFIEAVPSLSSHHRLLAASSLSTCNSDGHVTFRLLNPTSDSLVLHKGTIIGSFTELSEDTITNFGSEPQMAPVSVHRSMPCTPDSDSPFSSVSELRSRVIEHLENAKRIVDSNTKLAQQRMKCQDDKTSSPVTYDIGSRVWVYTPKSRKGLSKKLAHNYHGPCRVVAKLSPVHVRLCTRDNKPVSVPVHANRMKPYYDPSVRPISIPSNIDTFADLADTDLPSDSFDVRTDDDNTASPRPSTPVTAPPITRPEDTHAPAIIQGI